MLPVSTMKVTLTQFLTISYILCIFLHYVGSGQWQRMYLIPFTYNWAFLWKISNLEIPPGIKLSIILRSVCCQKSVNFLVNSSSFRWAIVIFSYYIRSREKHPPFSSQTYPSSWRGRIWNAESHILSHLDVFLFLFIFFKVKLDTAKIDIKHFECFTMEMLLFLLA